MVAVVAAGLPGPSDRQAGRRRRPYSSITDRTGEWADKEGEAVTLWLLTIAFLLMSGCLAAALRRVGGTWIAAVCCVALTLLIYVLLSDVAIGVSL